MNDSAPKVLWPQVVGLGFVQGAITLAWVVYNLYLKKLLVDLGFSEELAGSILVVENLLAIALEPLMGSCSDRVRTWVGTRFPLIASGAVLSAICFIAIPATSVFGNSAPQFRLLLPAMMVVWALAMTVFRSPALSLLGKYAKTSQLPQAAGILTICGGLAAATRPLAKQFILSLGAMAAFAIASAVLLVAVGCLNWLDSKRPLDTHVEIQSRWRDLSWKGLGLILGTGAGIALGFRVMMANFSKILSTQAADANANLIMGTIFLALAVTALPAGKVAAHIGNHRAFIIGLVATALLFAIAPGVGNPTTALLLAIALGSAYSLASNSTIPFALSLVPPDKGGLGVGLFFGGSALSVSLFNATLKSAGIGLGVGAFLVASLCVAASQTLKKTAG